MTATRIRCGVAGTGSLGQHHARIYSTLPGAELAGIYEPNDARAAEMCAKYHCHRFASLEEMAEGCDAVSVVVPTNFHAAVALPLLAAGCNLLIEKPICVTLEE
ncbi:MAG: gfo/Idh/MocA family oxidoreductase, partial [Verrucomicrobia bacterium]|nr:gfo/Idh/MocA family oxidoreductase [Verrucomicrobiota bacterium]